MNLLKRTFFSQSGVDSLYNTIPGSAIATHIALSYSIVQVNPTVERGPPRQKVKDNQPSTQKAKDKDSEAQRKDK